MEKIDKIMEIAKKANKYLERSNINVPILEGLKLINVEDNNVIFVASDGNVMEQFLTDGELNSDSFKERIEKNVTSSYEIVNNLNSSCNINFLKDYKTDYFNFKIYNQEIIINNSKTIRQLVAYFVDSRSNYFYEITLSCGVKTNDNLEMDSIMKLFFSVLDNTKYFLY